MSKRRLIKYVLSSVFIIFMVSILSGKLAAQQLNVGKLAELHYGQSIASKVFYKGNIQTKISVNFTNLNLDQALQKIAQKGNLKLTYRGDIVPKEKRVTLQKNDITVTNALNQILKDVSLDYRVSKDRYLIIIPKENLHLKEVDFTVSGIVTDAKTGNPLIGVNILVVGTSTGTVTDANGHYSLKVPSLKDSLRFSYIGYKTKIVPINGRTSINVSLQSSVTNLNQVVVTGFGKQSKIQFTGSASTVNVKKAINHVPVVNVSNSLMGSVSGLQISRSSGTPGTKTQINIRGISSINANSQPLFVINGVPVSTGNFHNSGDIIDNNSDVVNRIGLLSTLNPQSIKSITVLKGPVATAQYGARGSNGVIVITTKSGNTGETMFNINIQRGFVSSAVDGPQPLNSLQSAELYREGRKNAGLPVPQDIPFWNGPNDDIPGIVNEDWKDLAFRDHAMSESYGISASGGHNKATFFAAFNYLKKENVIITSQFKRMSGNINFSYKFNKKIKISNQLLGSYNKQKGVRTGPFWGDPLAVAYEEPSFVPVKNRDGTWNFNMLHGYNSIFTAHHDKTTLRDYRVLNTTQLTVDILKNLTFKNEEAIDYTVSEQELYQGPVHGGGADVHGAASGIYTRRFVGTIKNSLKYIWNIDEENILNIHVIQSAQFNNQYILSAKASGFPTRFLYNLANAAVPKASFSANYNGSRLSFLGKLHYNYSNKIFIDATYRREGSSLFANGHRWGNFYAFGAGWLLSSEDFLDDVGWLDLLKIKASYGVTGNSGIPRNAYQAFLRYNIHYSGKGAAVPGQVGNSDLTWERAKKINVGLSYGFLNGRVSGDITYFHSNTTNLLYAVPLTRTSGFTSQLRNIGELVNKGIELDWHIDMIRNQSFNLSLYGNFTYVTNEVTELPTSATGKEITITNQYKYKAVVGYPVGAWYMRTWAGVDKHNGMPLWQLNRKPTQDEISSGKVFKLDRFGDTWLTSTYSLAEPEYQGANGLPTHYGSIGLTVDYKGFQVTASLYGSFGAKVYDQSASDYMSDGGSPLSAKQSFVSQLQRWQKPGDITNVPKRIYLNPTRSDATSSRWLYNANYLQLKTLRVAYHLPNRLLSKLGSVLQNVTVYMIGHNMWTYKFDEDLKWGPETGSSGFINYPAPSLETVSFGINIQF